jgi:sugar lactone lactonase YvrE
MEPLLSLSRADVFFDGTLGEVRLSHPEGVAVDTWGNLWCGGDRGEVYRIEADGSDIEQIASTGGFCLGLAFDPDGNLYLCDLGHARVFRMDATTGDLKAFADGGGGRTMRVPNFPVVDVRRGCLYVSDSYDPAEPGPGVWRFDLETGEGSLWYDRPMRFANGMALSPDGSALYVVESFGRRVVRVSIGEDGASGEAEPFLEGIERVPDGLAFDAASNLYVGCYEPSRVYRVDPAGRLELFIDDPEAHTLCHPTNLAFRGTELFCANLGRWHITRIEAGIEGLALP